MNLLEQKDFLMQLCSRLDNQSLELLSKTSLWNIIREFAQEQYFWYLRVQHLLGRELKQRIGDWKRAYYSLISSEDRFNEEFLGDVLAVEILLETGYNPSVDGNNAIRVASRDGYTEVVKLLLSDRRVEPRSNMNQAIQDASKNGHTEVVRLLLEDGRANPAANDSYSIRAASHFGYTEVVRLLLEDRRANPSSDNNWAIIQASGNGHIEVVRLLLQDGRADPIADDNSALQKALENRDYEVAALLEEDPRVKATVR